MSGDDTEVRPTMACEAEPRDGAMHGGFCLEYWAICVRGHERTGWLCDDCAEPKFTRCTDCPAGDPEPRVLVLRSELTGARARAKAVTP